MELTFLNLTYLKSQALNILFFLNLWAIFYAWAGLGKAKSENKNV